MNSIIAILSISIVMAVQSGKAKDEEVGPPKAKCEYIDNSGSEHSCRYVCTDENGNVICDVPVPCEKPAPATREVECFDTIIQPWPDSPPFRYRECYATDGTQDLVCNQYVYKNQQNSK